MAEQTGRVQFLGQVTGANQQLGAGATYSHPTGVKSLTTRVVGRVTIRASEGNNDNVAVANKTGAGTAVISLIPGESRDWIVYNPGERLVLGNFWITTQGADYAEVVYELR